MTAKIARAVREAVGIIERAVADRVVELVGTKVPRKPRDMQCTHRDARGRRCRSKSKGPRFQYLCDRHVVVAKVETTK